MTDRHPVWLLLDQMQMDLRQMQARMVELRSQVAALKLVERPVSTCLCGSWFRTVAELEEHTYHHHDGPLPAAWVAADRLAGDHERVSA